MNSRIAGWYALQALGIGGSAAVLGQCVQVRGAQHGLALFALPIPINAKNNFLLTLQFKGQCASTSSVRRQGHGNSALSRQRPRTVQLGEFADFSSLLY